MCSTALAALFLWFAVLIVCVCVFFLKGRLCAFLSFALSLSLSLSLSMCVCVCVCVSALFVSGRVFGFLERVFVCAGGLMKPLADFTRPREPGTRPSCRYYGLVPCLLSAMGFMF